MVSLAGDPVSSKGLNAEMRQAVLYERFLGHIADERVRELAHPGLVLRRVTPELVRSVLAGPCGLGAIDERQARQLPERLAMRYGSVSGPPTACTIGPTCAGRCLS